MPSKKKSKKANTVPDIDLSVLRTAIRAGGRMINQIVNGVHYGSQEIQQLLFEESDFIVECRICKNLFRSLPNFIAHKRIYCQEFFADSIHNRVVFPGLSEEETIIIQPKSPEQTDTSASHTECQSEETTVDKMINGEFQSSSAEYNFYTDLAQRIESQKTNKTASTMTLTKISSNPNAVMVTMDTNKSNLEPNEPIEQCTNLITPDVSPEKDDCSEDMQKEIAEVEDPEEPVPFVRKTARVLLKRNLNYDSDDDNSYQKVCDKSKVENIETVTTSAKVSSPRKSERNISASPVESYKPCTLLMRSKADGLLKFCDLNRLECLPCKQQYASRKSLLCHLQAKHSGKKMHHPCIYCDKSFSYFWGLTRHLISSHGKTRNQVDKMRKKLWQHVHSVNVDKNDISDSKSSLKNSPSKKEKSSTTKKSLQSKDKNQQPSSDVSQPSIVEQLQDRMRLLGDKSSRAIDLSRCTGCGKAFWKETNYKNHIKLCAKWREGKKELKGKTRAECIQKRFEQRKRKKVSVGKDENIDKTKTEKLSGKDWTDVSEEINEVATLSTHEKNKCETPNIGEAYEQDYTEAGTQVESNNSSPPSVFNNIELEEAFSVEEVGNAVNEIDFENETSGKRELTPEEEMLLVEEIWVNKQPGKPPEKVKSNRIYVVEPKMSKPHSQCQDSKKVNQLVDEVNLQCLECKMEFSSVSNVRRHVVRHLGWKRYKCKMCKFMSYNKSECNTHLYRTHSDRTRGFKANTFIVDLNKEASRLRNMKKQQTLSGKQSAEKFDPFEKSPTKYRYSARFRKHSDKVSEDRRKPGIREENIREPHVNKFNISTRNSTREFDTRPYQVVDRMSTLFTRKGYYPKADSGRKRKEKRDGGSVKESETEDDAMSTVSVASTRSTRSRMSDSKLHLQIKARTLDASESHSATQQTKEQMVSNRNIFESFKHEPVNTMDFLSDIDTSQSVKASEVEILKDSTGNVDITPECDLEPLNLDKKAGDIENSFSNPVEIDEIITSSDSVQGENIVDVSSAGDDAHEKYQSTKDGVYLIERPEFSTGRKSPKWSTRRYRTSSNHDSNIESTSHSNDSLIESKSDPLIDSNEEVPLDKLLSPENFVKKSLRIAAIKSAQESPNTEDDSKTSSPSKRSPKSVKHTGYKRTSFPVSQRVPLLKKHASSSKQRKSLESRPTAGWSGSVKSKVDWGKCVSVKKTACWRKGAPFVSRVVTKEIHVSPSQPCTSESQE